MHLDLLVALAGLLVGVVVGLTGMGGGALMTPILVLLFGIQPLAAVSSDLVASLFMKPVGGLVHLRRGTVHRQLVLWLALGSAPAAFVGVLVLKALGNGSGVQSVVKTSLGIALLIAVAMMVLKAVIDLRQRALNGPSEPVNPREIRVRPAATVAVGAVGGLVVGMTSVGSGSLIIVALLFLYPTLKTNDLVGTDLVQAVPLVGAAALGHVLFGNFSVGLTTSILIGSLPGVYVGARASAVAPNWIIRRAIAVVLLASALKLLNVPTVTVGWCLLGAAVLGPLLWKRVRRVLPELLLRRRASPDARTPTQCAASRG